MAGNELEVCKFIFNNLNSLELKHLNNIYEIATPIKGSSDLKVIKTVNDLSTISTQDSSKKADIYLNGSGVSIKQIGGSNCYNRLQRADLNQVFKQSNLTNIENKISLIDKDVNNYHQNLIKTRNVPWKNYFSEREFKKFLEFLMMKASPNLGFSANPAQYILEAPKKNISKSNIYLYTFYEYFNLYEEKISIAIRRQWVGQSSNSEHKRALSLSKKPDNCSWVFDEVVGEPKIHKKTGKRWRDDVPANERKTVYFLMIEKKK